MNELVNEERCIICGYYKEDYEVHDGVPLCGWCRGEKFGLMLNGLFQELEDEINSLDYFDFEDNALFKFTSDLGELSVHHPHLLALREIISTLLMNVQGQGFVDYYSIRGSAPRSRLIPVLSYLDESGLITINKLGRTIDEIIIPSNSPFEKAFLSMEASADWKSHDEPNFLTSYILIKGLNDTLNIINQTGTLEIGEGITKLYVSKGKLQIPKFFTAPLSFIIGKWSQGHDEFTENEISGFLSARTLNKRQRDRVLSLLAGTSPGIQHTMYKHELYSPGGRHRAFRFSLNPDYALIRERIRSRYR